jgi:hypothetical protein
VVRGNEAVFEIATREIDRQRAGHYPNIDVVASTQENTNANLAAVTAITSGARSTISQNSVGLQLSLPIFAGGSVLSRTREAVALREKARQDLEASRRAAEFNARQSYLNVTNGLAQVKALEQALVSSETALQSNRVGYEVGVRINIDVLNAQQQVFQTKRDLARARYDTILNGLRLKSAAGSLTENDVELVNALLGFEPGATPAPVRTQPLKPPTGMLDSPGTVPVAPSAKAGDPVTQKSAASASATPAKRTPAQAQKEKAASGKAVASTRTVTTRAEPATTVARPAAPVAEPAAPVVQPTAPVAQPAAPVVAPVVVPVAASPTPVVTPLAGSPAAVETPLETPAQVEKSVETRAPVERSVEPPAQAEKSATASAPVEKALETPAPVEKSVAAPEPVTAPEPVAAAAPAEENRPAEAPIVPVAMQPSPALEKALPAPEAVGSVPAGKTAVKKESAKAAPKSVSSKTRQPARDAAATQALVAEATSVAPIAPAVDAPPVRVYSVVEPKIPASSRAAVDQPAVDQPAATNPASDPKQD